MGTDNQATLLQIPDQPAVESRAVTAPARLRLVHRDQIMFAQICVEDEALSQAKGVSQNFWWPSGSAAKND